MFVPVVVPDDLDNVELYALSVQASAKRGTVDLNIAKALDDGCINASEAEAILASHNSHMSARHSEVLAAIELHRPKSGMARPTP